jgi:hypothetical protein
MSGRAHVCEVYRCPTRASRALWGLLEAADFLIERHPFARTPAWVKGSGADNQVSAVHQQAAPHFKSAFAGCGHCAAHATVGNGP